MNWEIRGENILFNEIVDDDLIDILSTLTDDGIGTRDGVNFTIPTIGLYELSDGQRHRLGLPDEYPYSLFIENDGMINRDGFKYIYKFTMRGENGAFRLIKKEFPILTLHSPYGNEFQYFLPLTHFEAIKEIERSNSTKFVDSSTSYNVLASIKEIARKDRTIRFNEYLDSYDIHPIKNIKLSINSIDGNLDISPELPKEQLENENIHEGELAEAFDRRNRVLPIYSITGNDGKGHKVVLPEQSVPALEQLKEKFRHITDKAVIQQMLDSPESLLDEDIFDLREFYSDRVIRIGLYHPTFFGFICPYKSEWIPGISIEDKYNGRTNIILKTDKQLQELQESIDKAVEGGLNTVEFHDYHLDLEQATEVYRMAVAQNCNPHRPVISKTDKRILIIEENAESLGYSVDDIDLDAPSQYEFHNIEGLNNDYQLKHHQLEGIAWLQHLVNNNSKGCLLADDMGLGKTLQTLCFIDWHNRTHNKERKPYLIVAPVSLLDNWKKEITKFMKPDSLDCIIVHGGSINRKRNEDDINWLKKQNVILTNYETVRSCQFNLCAVDYAAVILDEAQKIKTPGTYITYSAKALKADFKIAMTGTPVENTFLDLWSIMDFAIPGLLGNAKDFAKDYQNPLKSPETDVVSLGRELRERMGVFFLRRQKHDVLADLPIKNEYKREVVMTAEQQGKYLELIREAQTTVGGPNMLDILTKLRRLSDSIYLVDKFDLESLDEDLLINSSAKIQDTILILDTICKKGEKAILFCIYKESQRMLQRILKRRYHIPVKIINGDTKVISTSRIKNFETSYSRQQAIDDFERREGFGVIIMSPIAAGMGLNVTAANHVIHFGRHWNPAKETQATDRAYRIGQTKTVSVYYPITTLSDEYKFNSFDQTLDSLLMRKTELADATLFPSEAREIQLDDFKSLLEQS